MKRIIKLPNPYGTEDKYVLRKEYNEFGIYEEKTPSGYSMHQSWAITNEKVTVQIESYNDQCMEELLDMIDNYHDNGKFGIKAFNSGEYFIMHSQGKMCI